ncbi:DUF1858 domain-containing protein [candidate division KSB1 bacterium]
MNKTTTKITPDITIEELVESYPKSVGFLMDHGIVCIKCGEPVWGTLGETITRKSKDTAEIVENLNIFLS